MSLFKDSLLLFLLTGLTPPSGGVVFVFKKVILFKKMTLLIFSSCPGINSTLFDFLTKILRVYNLKLNVFGILKQLSSETDFKNTMAVHVIY